MRAWTRWQDWVTLVAGAYAALSPIWTDTTNEGGATATLITLGVLVVLSSLLGLARPGLVATEWLSAIFGVLLFVAPWVLTYTGAGGASWTSWIVGILGVAMGLTAVPVSNRAHREAIQ